MTPNKQEQKLRIILEAPPAGVDFGLQKGSGSKYETIGTQRSGTADLTFELVAGLKKAKDGSPDFTGPFVQGPPGSRFVYIDIGTCAGQRNTCWTRRLKVLLRDITWQMTESPVLETRVPGKAKDGGPNCATVKPFPGWHESR